MIHVKRMTLIAIVLCAVLLGTGGAGVVAAKQELPPSYRVVQYDVTYDDKVVGKLSVNTNAWTYVTNAQGLERNTLYYLYCAGKFPYVSKATTNGNGELHMQGAWDQKVNVVTPADSPSPTFFLTTDQIVGTGCKATQITDVRYEFLLVGYRVQGTLLREGDGPYGTIWGHFPNQKVYIDWWNKRTQQYETWATATTDANGHFSVTKGTTPIGFYPAIYYFGGAYDGNTYCSCWG